MRIHHLWTLLPWSRCLRSFLFWIWKCTMVWLIPRITSRPTSNICSQPPYHVNNAKHVYARALAPASKVQLSNGTRTFLTIPSYPLHNSLTLSLSNSPVARNYKICQVISIVSNNDVQNPSETTWDVSTRKRSPFHSVTKRQRSTLSKMGSSQMENSTRTWPSSIAPLWKMSWLVHGLK